MYNGLFNPPQKLIDTFLGINDRCWKNPVINEAAIRALGDPPDCPVWDDELSCLLLLFERGKPAETFWYNYKAMEMVIGFGKVHKLDGVENVRLLSSAKPRPIGLRWAVVVGRMESVSANYMRMGPELPMLAALHPDFAKAMGNNGVKFVDAPDIEPISGHCSITIPCLIKTSLDHRVGLSARFSDVQDPRNGSAWLR